MIALPLLARLYVRKKDLPAIDEKHRPAFATKLELAVELVRWAKGGWISWLAPVWVVADGAYAKAAFLRPLIGMGVVVVSRLRKDAALWTVPVAPSGSAWPPSEVRGEADRVGQAGRAEARVDDRDVRVVRGSRPRRSTRQFEATVAAGGRCDPCGAGGRAQGVGRVLLYRPEGNGGRRLGVGGGSVQPGDGVPGRARRSWARVSNRCAACGRAWVGSTCACGRSR